MFHRAVLFSILLAAAGCFEKPVPYGRIRVLNHSQDRTHNVLKVSASGRSFSLKPGQSVLLPPHTRSISFSRQYRDYIRRYRVECPPVKKGISIKLIDVHVNRIAGGCTTVAGAKQK